MFFRYKTLLFAEVLKPRAALFTLPAAKYAGNVLRKVHTITILYALY